MSGFLVLHPSLVWGSEHSDTHILAVLQVLDRKDALLESRCPTPWRGGQGLRAGPGAVVQPVFRTRCGTDGRGLSSPSLALQAPLLLRFRNKPMDLLVLVFLSLTAGYKL